MINSKFTCRTCKQSEFSIKEMKKEPYLTANCRGICKKCASRYQADTDTLRKAEINPEIYITCDDCDRIMKNTTGGRFNISRTVCRFCKSKNISKF